MIKVLLFACCFGVINQHLYAQNRYDDSVRRTLIKWNRETLNSLTGQYQAAIGSTKRAQYGESLTEFKGVNECKLELEIDTASLRYKFLAMFLSKRKNRDVFIVEANRMGATAIVRNYVVWRKKDGSAKVDYYFFSNKNEWLKRDYTTTIPNANISLPLSNYLVKSSEGFNYYDVIISHFTAGDSCQITSEYFTLGTLSRKCAVKDV